MVGAAVPCCAVNFISWRRAASAEALICRGARAICRLSTETGTITGWWNTPALAVAATDAMSSGLTRTLPCPMYVIAFDAPPVAGTLPSKLGTPVFQLRPRPNTSRASLSTAPSGRTWTVDMKAVLQEASKSMARLA